VSGRIRHGGNPILSWMAGNASVKVDASGNIKPIKPPHGSADRIDGVVALVMALGIHAATSRQKTNPRRLS